MNHYLWCHKWNSTFFDFSLIIEGTTEKVLQFIMSLRSIYNQTIGFIEQILYFWALQEGSNNKGSINWHYFCHENIFLVTFLELPPYRLMSVLHKDALFHCQYDITCHSTITLTLLLPHTIGCYSIWSWVISP
jgi:hypothetical protein